MKKALEKSSKLKSLNRNKGGYYGEVVDIKSVLENCINYANNNGWQIETVYTNDDLQIVAFKRSTKEAKKNIYISTGIHGDEPAGPLAIEELLKENAWPSDANLWILPCINPTGFEMQKRENGWDVDLNRDYKKPTTPEIEAHVSWLERQPNFDLAFCLHEDWEAKGFYLYEAKPKVNIPISEKIIEKVKDVFPIDSSENIDGYTARNGIIDFDHRLPVMTHWPEAIYLSEKKDAMCYTLETSSDFYLFDRVSALVSAVKTGIKEFEIF